MVPEGWMHTTFNKHIDCLTGFAFKSDGYSFADNDIRLLRGDNIEPGGLRWRDAKLWPENELDDLDRYQLQEGDFVIALDRTWISSGLKVAEVTSEDLPCLLVQRVARVRAKQSLEQSLLRQYFSGHRFEQYVKSVQTATAVPHISPNNIKEFTLLLPTLPEQKKIAQILSTWDQAITATEHLLENTQKRKKGLMQQLLTGKKRLPGFEGKWESKPISQTGKIISGGTPDTNDSDLWGGDVQWLTPTDITALKTHFIYDTPRKITEKGVKESSATLMPSDSLCVCTRASVGLMAISTTPITTNQGFKSVVPNNKHDVEFLYYLFSFNRHVFIRYSSGSTFMELSKKDFAKITLDYPLLAEQKAIAGVLTAASDEIEQLQKQVTCLKQEKKALMQQLLTGKRRVKVDTEAA